MLDPGNGRTMKIDEAGIQDREAVERLTSQGDNLICGLEECAEDAGVSL